MYTVYNLTVSALGSRWVVAKRFSELQHMHDVLKKSFPKARFPKFPSKGGLGGFLSRMDDSTIEKRRNDLQVYMDGVLSRLEVSRLPKLRQFL